MHSFPLHVLVSAYTHEPNTPKPNQPLPDHDDTHTGYSLHDLRKPHRLIHTGDSKRQVLHHTAHAALCAGVGWRVKRSERGEMSWGWDLCWWIRLEWERKADALAFCALRNDFE
jgi:hypothetical protein